MNVFQFPCYQLGKGGDENVLEIFLTINHLHMHIMSGKLIRWPKVGGASCIIHTRRVSNLRAMRSDDRHRLLCVGILVCECVCSHFFVSTLASGERKVGCRRIELIEIKYVHQQLSIFMKTSKQI